MKTYLSSGIKKDIPYVIADSKEFFIQDLGSRNPDRYIYPNYLIKYELDNELVLLYDTLQDLYFEDDDNYYNEIYNLPIWIREAGHSSSCDIKTDTFKELINKENSVHIPNLYKHLYLIDCQFLVETIGNLLSSMEDAFIRYYVTLATLNIDDRVHESVDGTLCVISEVSRCASSLLETYFTKAYSILDVICKISFEIQNKNEDFDSYRKIKSANKLWGNRKKLLINETKNTLFEPCDSIRMIESLRNEFVHNGTWELNPKIYVHFDNENIEEIFMLFPDMFEGRLANVKGRRHFFSDRIKVNEVLPIIHLEFKKRLLCTVKLLNNRNC